MLAPSCDEAGAPAPRAGVERAEDPAAPGPGASPAGGPQVGAGEAPVPSVPPGRVFTNRSALRIPGEWFPAFRERLNPAVDGWWSEVVGLLADREVSGALREVLRGERPSALLARLDAGFEGTTAIAPGELETVRDAHGLVVRRARAAPSELYPGERLEELLRAWLAPLASPSASVHVDVPHVQELEHGSYRARVAVRVFAPRPPGRLQANASWDMDWKIGSRAEGVTITRIEVRDVEEVDFAAAPFAELTEHVLARVPARPEWQVGASECLGRVDVLAGLAEVFLGMHGIALGDVDGDGREDLYVGEQGGTPNRLLLAQPDGTLREAAAAGGVDFLDDTSGVLVADVDSDGAQDLVLGCGERVAVLYGAGDGTFPRGHVMTCPTREQVYSVSAADFDGDRDLDLYATRYVAGGVVGGVPTPYHDAQNGASNVFWRNDGEQGFVDATAEVGLGENNQRFSLASIWEDFDGDGDLDLYVTNDFGRNNLYLFEGGRFSDVAGRVGASDMAAGMGVSIADVELDGDLDVYVSNMYSAAGSRISAQPAFMHGVDIEVRSAYERHARGNTLLLNDGAGRFVDATEKARCGPGGWAWGAVFGDFDNDAFADLYVPNGFLTTHKKADLEGFFWRCVVGASPPGSTPTEEYRRAWQGITRISQAEALSWNGREQNYAYWNLGDGTFVDASAASGLDYADDGRAACAVDWDGDGRLDLWLRNRTAPTLRFVHNRAAAAGSWIAFELTGVTCNRDAVGALVEVRADGRVLRRRRYAGEGYLAGAGRRLHFGLGAAPRAERVVVRWPDGTEDAYSDLAAGRTYAVEQGAKSARALERAFGALASATPRLLETRVDPARARVPLADRLPLSHLELASWAGEPREVADFAGKPLALVLWASWDAGSVASLAALGAARARLEERGVEVWPLSMDRARDEAFARSRLAGLGLAFEGGRLGEREKTLVEFAILEVIGNFDDLPLPVALLFDGRGQLGALYLGALDPERLALDAEALERGLARADARWPLELTGGRWLQRGPERRLEQMRRFVKRGGYRELAEELERAIEERGR